jgi:hypothetical protein
MPCNCGGSRKKVTYVAVFSDGTTKVYASEVEARIAVQRNGGSYRASS